MRAVLPLLLFVTLTTNAANSAAVTWTVRPDGSGDAPTIQAAIDTASAGDTILLTAGVYTGLGNRDVSFLGKAVTVTSESGAAVTTVDCEGVSPAFRFDSGEGSGSILSDLTITNGSGASGGGIQITNGSPVIQNNVLTYCTAGLGGGLYCATPVTPSIQGNTFSYNSATLGGGVMIFSGATPEISGNTISYNTASSSGGGIYDGSGTTCAISGNQLLANESTGKGGAISVSMNSTPEVDANVIEGNKAWGSSFTVGAGIYCEEGSNALITNNTISDNWYPPSTTLAGSGGGVGIHRAAATILGNVFRRNGSDADFSGAYGGAIQVYEASAVIAGNDFFANTSGWGSAINVTNNGVSGKTVVIEDNFFHENVSWQWGAVTIATSDVAVVRNCTFVDNRNGYPIGCGEMWTLGPVEIRNSIFAFSQAERALCVSQAVLICCDIYGNAAGDGLGGGHDGGGNFSSDPLFCDLPADNVFLAADSPCLPAFNSCGLLVGARSAGCGPVPVRKTTWGGLKALLQGQPLPEND